MRALRQRIWSRLRSSRGDTLVEALAALLIAAMGAALLATMVMASTNITITNQKSLKANYRAEQTMAKDGFRDTATISMGSASAAFIVQVYQPEDETFTRYENEFPRSGVTP